MNTETKLTTLMRLEDVLFKDMSTYIEAREAGDPWARKYTENVHQTVTTLNAVQDRIRNYKDVIEEEKRSKGRAYL